MTTQAASGCSATVDELPCERPAKVNSSPKIMNRPGNRTRATAQATYVNNLRTNFTNNFINRRALSGETGFAESCCKVEFVELYKSENAKRHYTDQYELSEESLILRRGFKFFIALRTNRPFDSDRDEIRIFMEFGPKPLVAKGTKAVMIAGPGETAESNNGRWDAVVTNASENDVIIEIASPPNCQIGIWRCSIATGLIENKRAVSVKKVEDDIYMLLNPWHENDLVYLSNDDERNEYVLNDVGKVWMGSYKEPKGRRWVFGQFEDVVLPCTILLLELSDLPHEDRGNPILLARAISAVVNDADEGGLVIGRWDGDYSDGTSPYAWTGSLPIMEEYMRTGEPVAYAQCWVFSALTVTICRALGLPCRTTTNYVSAHDTNSSLTVDKYFDYRGEEIVGGPDGSCHDSCWNFHVWNDVWMSRPDLPRGYGGWQIIDATPQEMSESMMRCGPASVEAVRKGQVGFLYDTPFVFSEVNADVCHFKEDPQSHWGFSRSRTNQYHVGRRIITKMVGADDDNGDSDMWDVTGFYKSAEGSREERMAVFNAVRGTDRAHALYDFPAEGQEDVFFDLVEIDKIHFGQPFDLTVNIENRSNEVRNIDAVLTSDSIFYTGVTVHRLKRAEGHFQMEPHSSQILRCQVLPEEYESKLVDHSLIKIHAIATVSQTRQTWSEEDDFPLIKPPLDIKVDGRTAVGEPCTATFSFTNPLNRPLTNCTIRLEGPGLQYPKFLKTSDVDPNGEFSYTESFHPRRPGDRKFVATFSSDQLADISGSATVTVESP
ncbi:Transglutaminase family [Nesidiocoris tenuis]|uniref:Transglutaminase family n=1 Tax=Nesidiocoris tenuis TaxID=355587 RepID=A0ABN7AD38_9HEMI|nr:Transglutaminase family [Nesidiocoris tenuis]